MNLRTLLKNLALVPPAAGLPGVVAGLNWRPLASAIEDLTPSSFQPTWQSLAQYRKPDWFRDG